MTIDVSVDIETMGTGINAPIIAIGACKFDRSTKKVVDKFYRVISFKSAFRNSRADGDTVEFWLKQSEEARLSLIDKRNSVTTKRALEDLYKWFPKSHACVWGNGPAFDMVLLERSYEKCNLPVPWRFWHHRCFRTIVDLAHEIGITYKKNEGGIHHNALDDAVRQAKFITRILHELINYDD